MSPGNTRRKMLGALGLTGAAVVVPRVWAQSGLAYPTRPVRLLCPFAAAGGVDQVDPALVAVLAEPGEHDIFAVEARASPCASSVKFWHQAFLL